jgi:hypothetical protein
MEVEMKKKDERAAIAENLYKAIEGSRKSIGADDEYIGYMIFSICGSFILQSIGEEGFDEIVAEIKAKAGIK